MTKALALRPGEDMVVRGYFEEAQKLLKYAEERVITSYEDMKPANNDLSVISKIKKAMTNKRREYLAPLKIQADEIRDTYDYLMEPILEADRANRDKMLLFNKEQERIRLEQENINRQKMELAEAEMELNGELSQSVDLVKVTPEVKRVSTDMGTSGMTDHWKYEVVDVDLLPRVYMIPDHLLLAATAKKCHDQKAIDGVRFYNEPFVTVRA